MSTSVKENIDFIDSPEIYSRLVEKLNAFSSWLLITDEHTNLHCKPLFFEKLRLPCNLEIVLKSGENEKNLESLVRLWEEMFSSGLDRKSAVVNLGGGMVTDLGGMAAATYKRGIAHYNIPTSLLGIVDASIGGKNGINFNGAKNQLGTISPAEQVIIDTDFIKTLPEKELLSGFAEVIKHALIADPDLWKEILKIDHPESVKDWSDIVRKAVMVKQRIVERDHFEQGERKLLNFGHTVGHALEAHLGNISHGHAVALGMILESGIAVKMGILDPESAIEVIGFIQKIYDRPKLSETDIDHIIELARQDKKNRLGELNFSLIDKIGSGRVDQVIDESLFRSELKNWIAS